MHIFVIWSYKESPAMLSDNGWEEWHTLPPMAITATQANRRPLWGHACGRGHIAPFPMSVTLLCNATWEAAWKDNVGWFHVSEETCLPLKPNHLLVLKYKNILPSLFRYFSFFIFYPSCSFPVFLTVIFIYFNLFFPQMLIFLLYLNSLSLLWIFFNFLIL